MTDEYPPKSLKKQREKFVHNIRITNNILTGGWCMMWILIVIIILLGLYLVNNPDSLPHLMRILP